MGVRVRMPGDPVPFGMGDYLGWDYSAWWGGKWHEVSYGKTWVSVTRYVKRRHDAWAWCVVIDATWAEVYKCLQEGGMASKWIAAAVAAAEKCSRVNESVDTILWKDRPALYDFMTEIATEDGKGREPSVLMVCVTVLGLRVGLKDEAAGGWLWREAATFSKALDAIETALQKGNVQWAIPGGRYGKKK